MGHPNTQYLSPILCLSHVLQSFRILCMPSHSSSVPTCIPFPRQHAPSRYLHSDIYCSPLASLFLFLTANLFHYHRTYVILQWDSASLCTPSNCSFHVPLHIPDTLHGPDSWISFLTPASCISHFSRPRPQSTFCDLLVTSASFYPPRPPLALFCLNALSLKFVFIYARPRHGYHFVSFG